MEDEKGCVLGTSALVLLCEVREVCNNVLLREVSHSYLKEISLVKGRSFRIEEVISIVEINIILWIRPFSIKCFKMLLISESFHVLCTLNSHEILFEVCIRLS